MTLPVFAEEDSGNSKLPGPSPCRSSRPKGNRRTQQELKIGNTLARSSGYRFSSALWSGISLISWSTSSIRVLEEHGQPEAGSTIGGGVIFLTKEKALAVRTARALLARDSHQVTETRRHLQYLVIQSLGAFVARLGGRFRFRDAAFIKHLHQRSRDLIGIMTFDLVPMDHLHELPIAQQRKGR